MSEPSLPGQLSMEIDTLGCTVHIVCSVGPPKRRHRKCSVIELPSDQPK